MSDCERQIREYMEDLDEDVQSVLDDALEILKISSMNGENVGYIVVLATGGPHVEINTRDGEIGCWWGGDTCIRSLSSKVINEIDEYLDEIFP